MNDQRKEIIVSKRLIPFYKECYEKYGYRVEAEWRNKHHLFYNELEATIRQYQQEKDQRRYNLAETFFCALRIYMPLKNRDHYFCSEFVSEQLQKMEDFKLRKSARMYLPTSLAKALIQQPNLYRVLVNEV